MKIGLGLYRHMLSRDYYDFARQAGCTHIVIHLVDYFKQSSANPRNNQPTGGKYEPWGVAGDPDQSVDRCRDGRKFGERSRMPAWSWFAIENIDPAFWYDIFLTVPSVRCTSKM